MIQWKGQASNSTYLASVSFCIIMLHISCCVFMYPAGYIIGSVLSHLHANKQNRTEQKRHLLQGTATTDNEVAPAKTNES